MARHLIRLVWRAGVTVGVGVIGAGKMGSIHLDTLTNHLPAAYVAAVCSTDLLLP